MKPRVCSLPDTRKPVSSMRRFPTDQIVWNRAGQSFVREMRSLRTARVEQGFDAHMRKWQYAIQRRSPLATVEDCSAICYPNLAPCDMALDRRKMALGGSIRWSRDSDALWGMGIRMVSHGPGRSGCV